MHRTVPCGCRLCGCVCADHSPDRVARLCAAHVDAAVFRFLKEESARLVCLALFAAVVLTWAAILSA